MNVERKINCGGHGNVKPNTQGARNKQRNGMKGAERGEYCIFCRKCKKKVYEQFNAFLVIRI